MKKYIIIFCCLFTATGLSAQLRINELMQSNVDCLMDDLFEFPDSWVEIYNESDEPVNLNTWYLGTKKDYRKGWHIRQDTVIPPKGYFVIFCDKVGSGIHTDFRLETTKETNLYLFDPSGNKIDEVKDIPAQPHPNIAYGKVADGTFAFLIEPTPGFTNSHLTATQITPAPVFEQRAGIYKTPVTVILTDTSGIPGAKIHFTLDNSEPDSNSPFYTVPIPVDTTTVVRAKVIAAHYLIPRSVAQTYIITDRDFTLPVISISTDNRYLWDDSIGIYCVGVNGGKSGEMKANFFNNWRRPIVLSYFPDMDSDATLNQLSEIRIAGGGSRIYPSKSMIVYSHKRFGKNEYSYPIFQSSDKRDVVIKSMMLRNSGQDFMWTYLNDAANQSFMGGKVDLDYQAYQPAILYLNGQYWGIINIRERSEEDYVYGNYDRLEDVDVIENWYDVKAGDNVESNRLIDGVNNNKFSYEELKEMVGLPEFINFSILHMFVANRDYPHGNIAMWRKHGNDGKWRFIVKDTDLGGIYNEHISPQFNALDMLINPVYDDKYGDYERQSALFRSLMKKDEFKNKFIQYFTVYLGDILSPKETYQIVDSLRLMIEQEMPYHLTRFNVQTPDEWNQKLEKKKKWLQERIPHQYQHLNDYMSYGGLIDLVIEKPAGELNNFVMQLNGIDLQTNQFDGMYYKGQMFRLDWKGTPSMLKKWQVTVFYSNREEPVITDYTAPTIEIKVDEMVERIHILPVTTEQ